MNPTNLFTDCATIRDALSVTCERHGVVGKQAAQVLKTGREARVFGCSTAAAIAAGSRLARHYERENRKCDEPLETA